MKRKKFSRRLYLKKTTIADLSRLMMKVAKGAGEGRCTTDTIGITCDIETKPVPAPAPMVHDTLNTC